MLLWTLKPEDLLMRVVTEKKLVSTRYHYYLRFESGTWDGRIGQ
jgi:hypothetical protein